MATTPSRTAGATLDGGLTYNANELAASRLKRENDTIKRMRSENAVLERELALEARQAKMTTSSYARRLTDELHNSGDVWTRKIEQKKRQIVELESQLLAASSQLFHQQQRVGGLYASRQNSQMIAKQIRILENRLNNALKKFNQTLQTNRELRADVDDRRRERVVFDGIYKRLERESFVTHRDVAAAHEEAEKATELRDTTQREMNKLKALSDAENLAFEAEWKKVAEVIGSDRDNWDSRPDSTPADSKNRGELTIEQEEELKKKIADTSWMIDKDKQQIQQTQDKVASYEHEFKKIQDATGITGIDELVNKFIEAEEKNYSLFNYVNTLASDIEKMEKDVAAIKKEVDTYKGHGVHSDSSRKQQLRLLESRLSTSTEAAAKYEQMFSVSHKHLSTMKAGIQSLFTKTGCNSATMAEVLNQQGVTDTNIMQYMGIVEQRVNEIVSLYIQSREGTGDPEAMSLQRSRDGTLFLSMAANTQRKLFSKTQGATSRTALLLTVNPPSWDDLSSDDGSDDEAARPVTLEKLHSTPLRFRTTSRGRARRGAGMKNTM